MFLIERIKTRSFSWKFFLEGLIFLFAKSCVFFVPLLLSNYLSIVEYGSLEYTLSLGNVISIILTLGITGAYPVYILKNKKTKYFSSFLYHLLFILLLTILLTVIASFAGINNLNFALLVALILATQSLLSIICKTHQKTAKAILLDGGIYLIFLLLVILYSLGVSSSLKLMFVVLMSFQFFLLGYAIIIYNYRFEISKAAFIKYVEIIKFSFKLIISSFLLVLVTSIGRIYIEKFLSVNDVAIYSVYFRLAGPIFLIYKFIEVVYFKKIFTAQYKILDNFFLSFYVVLIGFNLLAFFIVPVLFQNYFILLKNVSTYRDIYFVLSMFMILWIGIAMNEPLIYKENLTAKFNLHLLLLIGLFTLYLLIIDYLSSISLLHLVLAHFVLLFLCNETQLRLLRSKHYYLNKTRAFNYSVFGGTIVGVLFLNN